MDHKMLQFSQIGILVINFHTFSHSCTFFGQVTLFWLRCGGRGRAGRIRHLSAIQTAKNFPTCSFCIICHYTMELGSSFETEVGLH